jgi:hypothetical protein
MNRKLTLGMTKEAVSFVGVLKGGDLLPSKITD